MEYAAVNWVQHLESSLARPEGEGDSNLIAKLTESLDLFLKIHWNSPPKRIRISKKHKRKLQRFQLEPFYGKLTQCFATTRSFVTFDGWTESHLALDLFRLLGQVRKRMEMIQASPSIPEVCEAEMKEMYGTLFKCPRPSCYHFNNGFDSRGVYQEHLKKHERPYRCAVDGCLFYTIGFATVDALENHRKVDHNDNSSEGRENSPLSIGGI